MRAISTQPVPRSAMTLTVACLEALEGIRAMHQIRAYMARRAFEGLVEGRSLGGLEDVGTIRMQMPNPRAVEVAAPVRLSSRWLACALRLDAHAGEAHWTCTDFRLVGAR